MKVDFSREEGTFKHLNGINLGPMIGNVYSYEVTKAFYRKINASAVRLHDVPLNNPGMKLVDIHQIFANFDADEDNPDNYYFEQTDDYIRECLDLGMEVLYRLGESIEHSPKKYFIHPPRDFAKWARICSHIVAHYNEGWADGHRWNIRYWAVWCEPNEWKLWSGTREQYFELYKVTATLLKAEHPDIKVGGPAWGGGGNDQPAMEAFLAFCKDNALPLDFFTWNQYHTLVPFMLSLPAIFKDMATRYGYPNAELQIGEWHYVNRSWRAIKTPGTAPDVLHPVYGMDGIESAAYTASVMIGFEDTPLDKAFFYTGNCGIFGMLDKDRTPTKLYYALEAYGTLMRHDIRVHCVPDELSPRLQHDLASQKGDCAILAGKNAEGDGAILISFLFDIAIEFQVEIAGMHDYDLQVRVVDADKDFDNAVYTRRGNTLTIRKPSYAAVYLIELFQHSTIPVNERS